MRRRDISGKTIVITGASSGIGQATAEAFARRGARLVLAARDPEALERVADICRQFGAHAVAVPTDVTDAAAVKELAAQAQQIGDGIDVWFSNVGVGAVGRFEATPITAHEQVIRINLIGHMNDAHAAVPIFLKQGYGTFINMISLGAFASAPFATAYSASKFGLKGFSEALRAELAGKPGIHICDVYPSFADTPGIRHGANYVGRALTAPPPVLNARRVAAAVVRIAERPRPSTTVGTVAHLVRLGHAVAPDLSARLMALATGLYFRHAPKTAITDGNLFVPAPDGARIDGGLRSPTQRVAAGTVALATGAVLAGVLLGRRSRAPRHRS